jgi:benzoyl-CoA 2,3-dioxygenase component B
VPGEYRAMLRRLVVIQGDTEPASVEQQRHLGKTAPSLYDMRNLFQVNVEEGRHLWAMVYMLHKYFGRDGRDEAEELLRRRSGSADAPRMLGAFNEQTPDWLSFFMFTTFTDRDGKMQLESLAQSGFDPLSRTCRFMLTEEAHHMFVGETEGGRRRRPRRYRPRPRARRDRPADPAEEAQPALHAVARPVRLRGLHQCGEFIQLLPEGTLPRDQDRRRSSA